MYVNAYEIAKFAARLDYEHSVAASQPQPNPAAASQPQPNPVAASQPQPNPAAAPAT